MAGLDRVCLDDLADYFEGLDDPRSAVNRRYPLVSVVVIALMAVLAGRVGRRRLPRGLVRRKRF